jgi:hypothetical protein
MNINMGMEDIAISLDWIIGDGDLMNINMGMEDIVISLDWIIGDYSVAGRKR